jgi:enediyne polyketide synthase
MACVYPDARTPVELWENVLAQRRAFRLLPPERLRKEDYWSPDRRSPDRSYTVQAAVIEGYEFDRVAFRVVGSTFRSTDPAHWLALDVASRALVDAGFPDGRGLPRESTGTLVGNTLTGEFSRAGLMRLRWPYVRRTVDASLAKQGWESEARQSFLSELESDYKSPFEPVGEESLAGGLSNTIAGRICNHFDFKGGGYTVDGACASSLLAAANGCSALTAGDLDVALAGGVDLSLDPFELVGFAKTGALAADEMRVFDRRSAGFWPGEGCGFVVLMRHEDALAQGCRIYAVIRGWGISSDGNGGITRPEAAGQIEAIRRAYRRAGFGPETVSYCEAHGTGTAVGDLTELEVLTRVRKETNGNPALAAIGSIKANIGHTKAAAGVAGLIKATMAVHTQLLPPTTGCEQPLPLCEGPNGALRVLQEAEVWPERQPLRASVSAMGFGGINAHVVIESTVADRRRTLSSRERSLSSSWQDAELFLFAAATIDELRAQIENAASWAPQLSRSELVDAAACLEATLQPGEIRAAVVAADGQQLSERLQTILSWLGGSQSLNLGIADGVFLASSVSNPRIGFLLPGQGSPAYLDGGAWQRRFQTVRQLYVDAALPKHGDRSSTRIMQPAIVTASLAGLRMLEAFGIRACSALGHSLGELTALHWAGVLTEEALLRIAKVRGAAMAELGQPTGSMVAVAAAQHQIQPLLHGEPAWLVAMNSPRQNVIAGTADAIGRVVQRATTAGWHTAALPVSHAFHTPLVAAATPLLRDQLAREDFSRLAGNVVSTIKGRALTESDDLREMLCHQVTVPVRFAEAMAALLADGASAPAANRGTSQLDLLIEVGPGSVLSGLAGESSSMPVVALDSGGRSLKGLLEAVGAAFVLGAPVVHSALFAGRFTRPFDLNWRPKFFANPCERRFDGPNADVRTQLPPTPLDRSSLVTGHPLQPDQGLPVTHPASAVTPGLAPFDLVRELVAERAELPLSAVQKNSRMLGDLHLNSITVGQLVSEAARRLSLPRLTSVTDFANATVDEIAQALTDIQLTGGSNTKADAKAQPAGAGSWLAAFGIEMVEVSRSLRAKGNSASVARPAPAPGWQLFAPAGHPFAASLKLALEELENGGVAVCLPETPSEEHIKLLLEGARAVLALNSSPVFLLVQHGWGGSGFARSLHLETPRLSVCVVNVPLRDHRSVPWIAAEAVWASGYTEAHYDHTGRRTEPRLASLQPFGSHPQRARKQEARPRLVLGGKDLLLVTGGGKGIAAE